MRTIETALRGCGGTASLGPAGTTEIDLDPASRGKQQQGQQAVQQSNLASTPAEAAVAGVGQRSYQHPHLLVQQASLASTPQSSIFGSDGGGQYVTGGTMQQQQAQQYGGTNGIPAANMQQQYPTGMLQYPSMGLSGSGDGGGGAPGGGNNNNNYNNQQQQQSYRPLAGSAPPPPPHFAPSSLSGFGPPPS